LKKANIIFVLLMLLLSMIPTSAEPIGEEKIEIAYIYSGSIASFTNAANDPIVIKYIDAKAYQGYSKKESLDQLKELDLDDIDIIILEHLDLEVTNIIDETLKTAKENGATIISVTGNTDKYATDDIGSEELAKIKRYIKNPSETNFKNLLLKLAAFKGATITEEIKEPVETEHYGIYHPAAYNEDKTIFKNAAEYLEWYKNKTDGGHVYDPDKLTIGVIPSSILNNINRDSLVWNYFVESIEDKGYNVVVGTFMHNATKDIGESANLDNFIVNGEVIIDTAIAVSRGSRFYSNAADYGTEQLSQLDVPVLHAIQLFEKTMTEETWKESDYGVIPSEHYQLAFGEQDGLIEPIVVAIKGEDQSTNTPIDSQAEWMTERAIGWAELSRKENANKKIVIPFYAAEAGKANIGSDPDYYLNAPESILNLLKEMKDTGYDVGEIPDNANELKEIMVQYGYNVGTWAPGELEKRVEKGNVTLLPVSEYNTYFETLPTEKQKEVKDLWDEIPGDIMIYEKNGEKYFVIPTIEFGNILLTPQPLRGRDQSIDALKHVGNYPPTHQMLATYYFINEVYEADAILPVWSNLGVMPGKQATLAADDWTALLIQDTPHIHMLPMDATGVTDKRRANMLVINFLTPYLMPAELYGELSELESSIAIYETVGADEEVKKVEIEIIANLCENLGLNDDLDLNWDKNEEAVAKIKTYLSNIKRSYIPYGDHVLGVPPTESQIYEMTKTMLSYNSFLVKQNGADIEIDLDKILEEKYGSSSETKKEELLTQIFSGELPADATQIVLGSKDSHVEYALTMALIYKLGIGNEMPTVEQAFVIANTLLSYDIYIQMSASAGNYQNLDTELTKYYSDEEAVEKKEILIEKVILNGEDSKNSIRAIFGNEVYEEGLLASKMNGPDIERLLKIVQIQMNDIKNPTNEIDSLLNALDAKYIPTGQTGDPIQNFEAIPTGRNPVQDDSRLVPTKAAYEIGKKLANNLIEIYQKDNEGKYPEKIAFLLWAVEAARTGGTNEGEIFALLGVEPQWQANGRLPNDNAFKLIPTSELARPRIDVVVETSGSYRDSYSRQVLWINAAIKLAAQAEDSEEYPNYVKRNSDAIYEALKEEYKDDPTYTDDILRELSYARVFGPPLGEYTPGIENVAGSGLEDDIDIADLYIDRMSNIYGLQVGNKVYWGEQMSSLLKNNLKDVEMGVFSRSSNLYGLLDHPMVASYFGGLASAIEKSGGTADMYINNLRNGETDVQSLSEFLSMDLSSRYLNPEWIKGMMDSGYAGTSHMNEFFDVMGIWEMTMPNLVTDKMWNNMYETYISDSKDTGVNEFLKKENAYAYQAMVANLLNSIYNGDWSPSEEVQKQLEKEYVEQTNINGVVCCHHTCSNMKFNENIVNGLLSMDISKAEKQKYLNELNIALDKDFALPRSGGSSGGTGSAFVTNSTEEEGLSLKPIDTDMPGAGFGQDATPAGAQEATTQGEQSPQITGYEMITKTMSQTTSSIKDFISNPSVSSSSIMAIAFVVLVVVAIFYGFKRKGI